MELAFYASALVAIYSTLRVISTSNPMHALLNLIISLIAVAMIFFCLGAAFAGALQVIVYAGAIMVLFVFVVMMLNLGSAQAQEKKWLTPMTWGGPSPALADPAGLSGPRHSRGDRGPDRSDRGDRQAGGCRALWPLCAGGGACLHPAAGGSGNRLSPGSGREEW